MNKIYPKELFQLQADFALFLVKKHGLKLDDVLFKNTSFYVRIIGHSDEHEPDQSNPNWKEIIANKPEESSELADYFYNKYLEADSKKKPDSEKKIEPCFHVYYHKFRNIYELHLDVNDPLGILSKDRIAARLEELRSIFHNLESNNIDPETKMFARTWLFNIEAFTRLFPESFSKSATFWNNDNKTYDNANWGQFLTKDKDFRTDVAIQFRKNWEGQNNNEFNRYFPYPALVSEIKLGELYSYYGKIH